MIVKDIGDQHIWRKASNALHSNANHSHHHEKARETTRDAQRPG